MLFRQDTLAKTPLFASLSPEEQTALANIAAERHFAPGQPLIREGAPCEGLFIIASGAVEISKISPSGREIMLAMERAPSSVAEVPLFDGGPNPATVTALQETVAFLLPKDAFRRFCETHPAVPLKVLSIMGRRLRHLVALVEAVTFGSVRQRLAQMLLEFGQASGSEGFSVPMSHEELASRLGTAREVVSRNLARFQADGLIEIVRRQIRILDDAGLRNEAETEY